MAKKLKTKRVALVALVVVVILGIVFYTSNKSDESVDESRIVVYVNDEPITAADMDIIYATTPFEFREYESVEHVLNRSIEHFLLAQDAKNKGFVLDDDVLSSYLTAYFKAREVSEKDFKESLEAQDLNYEAFKKSIARQLLINELIEQRISPLVEITNEDIKKRFTEVYSGTNATLEQEGDVIAASLLKERLNEVLRAHIQLLMEDAAVEIR